ncbi:MAG: hypothetical protein IPM71_13860 [Bacteroidota bacterium]|nr:MAG: hypothetical protein IPM71_13860 [Bacteroidota bacterium]
MTINGVSCAPMPGFSRYVISQDGRIYRVVPISKKEEEWLAANPEAKYLKESKVQKFKAKQQGRWTQVGLINDKGKFTTASVEKLLCTSYGLWPSKRKKFTIEWNDNNPENIHINNLRLRESKPRNAKLTPEDVKQIKQLLAENKSLRHIANTFGVSDMQISRIKSGENWHKGGRIIPIPEAPFEVAAGRMRRFVSSFEFKKVDNTLRKPFSLKKINTQGDLKISGIINGYHMSKKHKNITRANMLVYKLNLYFFTKDVADKINLKSKSSEVKERLEIV